MNARVLTIEEYAKLVARILVDHPVLPDHVDKIKQVHRLICDGHKVEELTAVEQAYAKAFEGALCVQIPNDYGWEPGIEIEAVSEPATETVKTAPPPTKPPKSKKEEK